MSNSTFATLVSKRPSCSEKKRQAPQSRVMRIEKLEARELLSLAPENAFYAPFVSADTGMIPAVRTIEEVEPVNDVIDITEAALDVTDFSTETTARSSGDYRETNAVLETPSTIVTTTDDVVDDSDGLISLREALLYADPGETITFSSALKDGTIKLNGSQLNIRKPVTIDASNLWDDESQTPGITIDAGGKSRVLSVIGDSLIIGLMLTNGYDSINSVGGVAAGEGTVQFEKCLIIDNKGIGVSFGNGTGVFSNCVINGNSKYGVRINYGVGTFFDCTISDNSSGGVLVDRDGKSGLFTNCTISDNSGTGVEIWGKGVFTNCKITENGSGGAVIYGSQGEFTNCVISGNRGSLYGGISLGAGSFVNCTISGNSCYGVTTPNGSNSESLVSFVNSIITLNYGGNVSPMICYSSMNTLIGENPLFVRAPIFENGVVTNVDEIDLHLASYSPYIDYVEDGYLGAYEFDGQKTQRKLYNVVTTLDDEFDLTNDVVSLREAVYMSTSGDTIEFAPVLSGSIQLNSELYVESAKIDGDGRITLDGQKKTRVLWADKLELHNICITHGKSDGNGGGVFICESGTFVNCTISSNITLNNGGGVYGGVNVFKNCTITDNAGSIYSVTYGGVSCGTGIFLNCTISNNSGGGVSCGVGEFTNCVVCDNDGNGVTVVSGFLTNCSINDNSGIGVQISNQHDKTTGDIENCVIVGNQRHGVYIYQGIGTFSNSKIAGNRGTGVEIFGGSGIFINCDITHNNGSGVHVGKGSFTNCTICGNTDGGVAKPRSQGGAGIFSFVNSIIAFNHGDGNIYFSDEYTATNSLIGEESKESSDNLVYDSDKPLFNDAASGDYTLAENSQAIDIGDNSYVTSDVDLLGNPRVSHKIVDLGAYEYQFRRTMLDSPKNLRETKTETSISVDWDAVANATGYELIYKKSTDSTYTSIGLSAAQTGYLLTGLSESTTYQWSVRALGDWDVYLTSDYATARSVKLPKKLFVPTIISTSVIADSITTSWKAVPNASRYWVYYKLADDPTWSEIDVDSALSFTVTGLNPNTEYNICVAAFGDGESYIDSEWSPIVTVKTPSLSSPLIVPKNLMEMAKGETSFTASWAASENAVGYELSYKKFSEKVYTTIQIDAATTRYTFSDLDAAATYNWRVRALGDGYYYATSAYSATRVVKLLQRLVPPSNLRIVKETESVRSFAWNEVSNAIGYRVVYSVGEGDETTKDLDVGTTEYTITGLESNALVSFSVCALGGGVGYSDSDFVTFAPEPIAIGAIQYVCQSLSTDSGATFAEATSTARTWIDEWSNFYMDVWTNGSGEAVTSVLASLSYDPAYFKVADVKATMGYTVSYKDEPGTVTVTAKGKASADSNGWTLVARIQFTPVGAEGVHIPVNGVLTAQNAGFFASASEQTVNGGFVETVTLPTGLKLYPCVFDVDENGSLNMNDLAYFVSYLGVSVWNISPTKHRVFDYDLNDVINMNDLAYVVSLLGKSSSCELESIYPSEPATASASSSMIDDVFSYFVEDDSDDATFLDFDTPSVLDETFETFEIDF